MTDKFQNSDPSLVSPASSAFPITPSDSTDLAINTRCIYVGVTGNITLNMYDGSSVTFSNVPAGFILPVRAKRILATGTTATSLIGMY